VSRFKPHERLLIAYFVYVALIAPFFLHPWTAWGKAMAVALAVFSVLWAVSREDWWLREWVPLFLTLAAYREMNWFTPAVRDYRLENAWIGWDRVLLDQWHFRAVVESAGALAPTYLELCYALVYAVAPVSIVILLTNGARRQIPRFWLAYVAGTLGSYALFPYFPSDPPRVVFAGLDLPHFLTPMRQLNLWVVGHYGIHSSVFPSAHVSSTLAAAWGLLLTLPERRWIGWALAVYALSVAVATAYGRYHYAVDAVAGIVISFLGLAGAWFGNGKRGVGNGE